MTTGTEKIRVPLLPLRDIVVFPYQTTPLIVGRQKSVNAVKEAIRNNSMLMSSTMLTIS